MELSIVNIVVIIVYISIGIEITFFPIPSVASTYQLFFVEPGNHESEGLLKSVHRMLPHRKVLFLFIPTVASVITYCIPLILVFLPALKDYLYPLHMLEHDILAVFSVLLMLSGRVVSLYSGFKIRPDNSQRDNDFSLKIDGVFKLSRNPLLLGMYITFSGLFLAFPSIVLIAGWLIYLLNMHFRVLLEEDFLRHKFGEEYENYFRNTRRYI